MLFICWPVQINSPQMKKKHQNLHVATSGAVRVGTSMGSDCSRFQKPSSDLAVWCEKDSLSAFPNMPPLQPHPPTVKGPRQAARLAKWRQRAQKSASYEKKRKKRIITQGVLWWNKLTVMSNHKTQKMFHRCKVAAGHSNISGSTLFSVKCWQSLNKQSYGVGF